MAAATTPAKRDESKLLCINCIKARFPGPKEQCYKFGGLICTVDDSNVEKYQPCKFPAGVGKARPTPSFGGQP